MHFLRLLLLLCFFIGSASLLQAQILKVNKHSTDADSSGYWEGSVKGAFSMNNRNSSATEQIRFVLVQGNGDIAYTAEHHSYFLVADARYFQSTGGPLLSTGFGHARVNLMRKQRLSYELFAQGQYDQGRNLEGRILGGGGLRLRITENLAAGVGVMQELESWRPFTEEASLIDKNLSKMSSYITGSIDVSSALKMNLTAYYQTGFDPADDLWRNRISASTSVNFNLTSKLAVSLGYDIAYEDRPIIALSKTVYQWTNGLKYTF